MDFDKMRAGVEEISVSDGFVVDIEAFSHLTERGNSRITSINHSRKGPTSGAADKKINPTAAAAAAAVEASSRATSPLVVVVAHDTSDRATSPKIHHHQITIKKGSLSSPSAETKHGGKRFGHRHSAQCRFLDPRRVVVFFATLSSMGTVLLIYFTLSMGKLNGNDNGLN
ncbi:uncharacterized protein LOC131012951 [Salvia miltiorrhiza]|uniref:uncharacterized protein LOC131012951 n=1 Tax=Salvia miltiorrhiza TaxID=226208 RepID=UPI0025AD280B|nr:uncharacterized protein LOC131012951 [Salvia miltiorrhiza]